MFGFVPQPLTKNIVQFTRFGRSWRPIHEATTTLPPVSFLLGDLWFPVGLRRAGRASRNVVVVEHGRCDSKGAFDEYPGYSLGIRYDVDPPASHGRLPQDGGTGARWVDANTEYINVDNAHFDT